jgi:hypothetical protein
MSEMARAINGGLLDEEGQLDLETARRNGKLRLVKGLDGMIARELPPVEGPRALHSSSARRGGLLPWLERRVRLKLLRWPKSTFGDTDH